MWRQTVQLVLFSGCLTAAVLGFEGKIVNGTQARDGEFPFVVSLRRASSGRHACGASILNRIWLLTAAHCVSRSQPENINVQYGSNALNPNSSKVMNISKIFAHEGYDPENQYIHDIALLKLVAPLPMGPLVRAARLPSASQLTPGNESVVLIGWGLNATGGTVQQQLQKVKLQTFDPDECSELHQVQMHATTLCAGVPEGGKGQCSGDSGGPLLRERNQIIGIVSWSRKPCTIAPYPGVFTDVASYVDWILQTMGDDWDKETRSNDERDETLQVLMSGNLIIVSLRHASHGGHFCAGTLLNSIWVLTAAHCFTYVRQPDAVRVHYGTAKLQSENANHLAYVRRIIIHDGYNPTVAIHDLALLELAEPLRVQAVKLPTADWTSSGNATATIVGWGLNGTSGNLQNTLQKLSLKLLPITQCAEFLNALVHRTNLCAEAQMAGQCSGDSGGPLLVDGHLQIGIVSWSRKPCASGPGVFTNVAPYTLWIREQIENTAFEF